MPTPCPKKAGEVVSGRAAWMWWALKAWSTWKSFYSFLLEIKVVVLAKNMWGRVLDDIKRPVPLSCISPILMWIPWDWAMASTSVDWDFHPRLGWPPRQFPLERSLFISFKPHRRSRELAIHLIGNRFFFHITWVGQWKLIFFSLNI